MLAAVNVHIVGGDPWWHQVIGPALIAATAIAAAWIAARTANHRQQEQLDHDRELQKEQLAYDREQRNRQHVRDTVDAAMDSVGRATLIVGEYEAEVIVEHSSRTEQRGIVDNEAADSNSRANATKRLDALLAELLMLSGRAYDVSTELTAESLKLALRLGLNHMILKRYDSYQRALSNRHEVLRALGAINTSLGEDDMRPLLAARAQEELAATRFFEACRTWYQSETS